MPSLPRCVLITGASSGLGRALAIAFAARAKRFNTPLLLCLTARDAGRLDETAAAAAGLGAEIATAILAISDETAVRDWVLACDAAAPLDVVIANAGRSAGIGAGPEGAEQVRVLIETNVAGVVNTVLPASACMRARGRGQIVILSSLAGHLPFPSTPTYSATKAFVRCWGLSLRPELAQRGVGLTVVSPGYIATPMTAGNNFHMPFLVGADRAAAHILRRLDGNPAEIGFPLGAVIAVNALSVLPRRLFGRLMLRGPRKHALTARN
jgi:short-subunit dehydrogenase